MFTKKEKEAINDAILEERERIKKIVRDNILHTLVPNSATISIDKFIQNLNDRIDNNYNRKRCKNCKDAWYLCNPPDNEYPTHCGYGLDGAVEIDDDFKCPKPE